MDEQKELRAHLLELLEGKFAHIDLETVIKRFSVESINERIENFPHTAWHLLEHIRIAQRDILEFSRDEMHVSPEFPDGYWNKNERTTEDWKNSVTRILEDLQAMRGLISEENTDLFKELSHGDGQTLLREVLLVADHNAYHLGQMAMLEKILGKPSD